MHTLDRVLVGARIRKRREELLISKKNLAEMLGITLKFWDDVESCIFREICASVPEERSAIPLETEHYSVC